MCKALISKLMYFQKHTFGQELWMSTLMTAGQDLHLTKDPVHNLLISYTSYLFIEPEQPHPHEQHNFQAKLWGWLNKTKAQMAIPVMFFSAMKRLKTCFLVLWKLHVSAKLSSSMYWEKYKKDNAHLYKTGLSSSLVLKHQCDKAQATARASLLSIGRGS